MARLPLFQAIQIARDPASFFQAERDRQGDPFQIRLPGTDPVLLTGKPEGARQIFRAPPRSFVPPRNNPLEPLLGPGSMILLSGEPHRRERKAILPPLHGQRMRAYGEIIRDAALEELRSWPVDAPVALQPAMARVTMKVIIQAVFGVRDPDRIVAFREVTEALLAAYTRPLMFVPASRVSLGGLGPWARFQKARAAFDALMIDELDRRESAPAGEDILSMLLGVRYEDGEGMSRSALLDELRTLLVAGHETTATGLTWALYCSHQQPHIRSRLREEVGEGVPLEKITALPYLSATCDEALRLHPVVPVILRRAVEDFTLLGVPVPAGESVGVAVSLLHRDPEHYPEPEVFRPERFLDGRLPAEVYAPFGGGARRCIGMAFAAAEMRTVLGTLMAHVDLELVEDRPLQTASQGIIMGPREALTLHLRGTRP